METIDEWEARRPAVLARQQLPPVNSYEDDDEYEPESPLDDSEPPLHDLQHEPPAVDGEQPEKKQKVEEATYASYVASISPDGVHQAPREHDMLWLHQAIAAENQQWNSFQAVLDSNLEVLTMEFDLDFISNRNRKNFLHNPAAFLVKKMRDTEVNFGKLNSEHQKLFTRAKAKEVSSFISNEAARRCLNDAEIKLAYDTGRILRARWVLTWKLVSPEDQASAEKDGKENPSTVHTRHGLKKAKARIVLLGYEHPDLGEASYRTSSPVCSVLARNLMYQVVCQRRLAT